LLFIGVNPSGESLEKKISTYDLGQEGNAHPYFKRFTEIANECEIEWTHLDLLFFKETNQKVVDEILIKPGGVEFIWQQLQISRELIEQASPKVIIVSNTMARRFLGKEKSGDNNKWLDFDFTWDDEIGTWLWNETPVFFSSMLTGQRALDKGSYERLIWQVKRSLQIIKERPINILREKLNEIKYQKQIYINSGRYEEVARLRDTEKELEAKYQEFIAFDNQA
jgi:hypothetical protein